MYLIQCLHSSALLSKYLSKDCLALRPFLNFVKGSGTLTTEVADFIASVNNFSNSFCLEVSTSSKNNSKRDFKHQLLHSCIKIN